MWRPARRRDPASSAIEGAEPDDSARADTLDEPEIPPEAFVLPELVVGIETGATTLSDDTAKSFGVAGWTLFSRVTGLLRVVVAGAILGPTFFANIFQATNTIPNITYNLMAGSLLTALIIPLLVAELDHGGVEQARRTRPSDRRRGARRFRRGCAPRRLVLAGDRAPAHVGRARLGPRCPHRVLGAPLPRDPADRALRPRGRRNRRPELHAVASRSPRPRPPSRTSG